MAGTAGTAHVLALQPRQACCWGQAACEGWAPLGLLLLLRLLLTSHGTLAPQKPRPHNLHSPHVDRPKL